MVHDLLSAVVRDGWYGKTKGETTGATSGSRRKL